MLDGLFFAIVNSAKLDANTLDTLLKQARSLESTQNKQLSGRPNLLKSVIKQSISLDEPKSALSKPSLNQSVVVNVEKWAAMSSLNELSHEKKEKQSVKPLNKFDS